MSQEGVVIELKNECYQVKVNFFLQFIDWLYIMVDINVFYGVCCGGFFVFGKDNLIWIVLNYLFIMMMMVENGNYNIDIYNFIVFNLVGILKLQLGEIMINVFNGCVDLCFDIMKGLIFIIINGVDYYDEKSYSFSFK